MVQLLLFVLFCVFAFVVAFGTFVVLYHFQRFHLSQNEHRARIIVFLIGSAFFIYLELSLAQSISWQDVFDLLSRNQFMR